MNDLSKFGYYEKELRQFRQKQPVSLRRIQLDPVSFCNHDCGFCIYRYDRDEDMNALFNKKDMLPFYKLIEIFDDCVDLGVKAIELTGGGEPTLHPRFSEILPALHDRDIEIGLVTNGAWRNKDIDTNIENLKNAVWVRFSLDAATRDTHRKTHVSMPGHFEKAIEIIRELSQPEHVVDVGISFIVQQLNYHELEDAVDLAEELGVKYIRIGGVVFEGERIDHIELCEEKHKDIELRIEKIRQEDRGVEIYDNFSTRSLIEFERYNEGDTCYYSHLATVIGADGKLYVCCVWKYRPEGVIDDLYEKRLLDIWREGALNKFYQRFDIANKCDRCFLKPKNDHLHSLVNAEHINFV